MHREDLMNADLLSEILLLVSGTMIFVTLLLILVAALTRTGGTDIATVTQRKGDEAVVHSSAACCTGYHSAWHTRTFSVRSQRPSVGQRPCTAGDHE